MRTTLAILLLATVAQAAPVPKPTEKEKVEAKFGGKIVDPKGDTEFRMDGDTLVVTMPAKQVRDYRVPTDRDTGKFVVKNSAVEIKLPEMKGEFEIAFTITAKRFKNLGKGDKCRAGAGLLIREFNDRKGDEKALLATPVDDFGGGGGDGVSPKISNVEYSPGRETFGGFDVGSTLEKGETVREQWKVVYRFDKRGLKIMLDATSKGLTVPLAIQEDRTAIIDVPVKASLIFVHESPADSEVRIDDFKITPIVKKK